MAKIIVFSAPSGSGKSTIINYLMDQQLNLHFSISATSRPPRGKEQHGVEYYFLTAEDFRQRIADGEFLEFCEVYEGRYYGTLKAEVDRLLAKGENVICDVDVVGAQNIKRIYGDQALTVFIKVPSLEVLRHRLTARGTDAPEVIEERIRRADYELSEADKFDATLINDNLETVLKSAKALVSLFLDA